MDGLKIGHLNSNDELVLFLWINYLNHQFAVFLLHQQFPGLFSFNKLATYIIFTGFINYPHF